MRCRLSLGVELRTRPVPAHSCLDSRRRCVLVQLQTRHQSVLRATKSTAVVQCVVIGAVTVVVIATIVVNQIQLYSSLGLHIGHPPSSQPPACHPLYMCRRGSLRV